MILAHAFSDSSMLANCSYDDETSELTITFLNGREYTYADVGKFVYEGLIEAKSPGKFFNAIKGELKLK